MEEYKDSWYENWTTISIQMVKTTCGNQGRRRAIGSAIMMDIHTRNDTEMSSNILTCNLYTRLCILRVLNEQFFTPYPTQYIWLISRIILQRYLKRSTCIIIPLVCFTVSYSGLHALPRQNFCLYNFSVLRTDSTSFCLK